MSDETAPAEGARDGAAGVATNATGAPAEGATAPEAAATTLTADKAPEAPPESQDAAPEAETKPAGAPEAYEAFTAPEGTTLDQAAIDAFSPVARDLNLTQEQAQKLVDLHAEQAQGWLQGLYDAHAKQRADWVAAAKADGEIGGADHADKVAVAKDALKRFGTPELNKALEDSGLGSHPEVVRFFHRVGKAIADDAVVLPTTSGGPRSPRSLYPNSDMR